MSRRPVLLLVGAALLVAGCSGPRAGSSVTSAVSGCATVLPAARALVGPGPVLVSVHALRGRQAAGTLAELGVPAPPGTASPGTASPGTAPPGTASPGSLAPAPPPSAGPGTVGPGTGRRGTSAPRRSEPADALPRTCAIVYRGPFPAAVLAQALPGSAGDYAVVLLPVRHPQAHTLVLVPVVPARLRRP